MKALCVRSNNRRYMVNRDGHKCLKAIAASKMILTIEEVCGALAGKMRRSDVLKTLAMLERNGDLASNYPGYVITAEGRRILENLDGLAVKSSIVPPRTISFYGTFAEPDKKIGIRPGANDFKNLPSNRGGVAVEYQNGSYVR